MKILLIDPPMQSIMLARADWYPMSLSYLAGSAMSEGHDVSPSPLVKKRRLSYEYFQRPSSL